LDVGVAAGHTDNADGENEKHNCCYSCMFLLVEDRPLY
jgi:hypothetical protein